MDILYLIITIIAAVVTFVGGIWAVFRKLGEISIIYRKLLEMDNKIDALEVRMNEKIDALEVRMNEKIDALEVRMNEKIDALEVRMSKRFDILETKVDQNSIDIVKLTYRVGEVEKLDEKVRELDVDARVYRKLTENSIKFYQ
ncbi:MAG: hypothetical protein LBG92_02560 [Prevotellaceae bacterium]|jgi:hypothetical protein|nr:hypothetical protein [Prevotellaceae bacterium]